MPESVLDLHALMAPSEEVDAVLRSFLASRSLPHNLAAAIDYAFFGGGKRLRPVLVLYCCEAVGGRRASALPAAVALELVHTFSLCHDDLPAMDDDDLRRGRPTLHRHTSEAMAILAGDGMLALAFELLAERVSEPALCSALVRELAVGTSDMIAGQVYDTEPDFPEGIEPLERLETTHRHKTGALLRAACRMGALCGRAEAAELEALSRYAAAIGLMFQVVDDLLDVTATSEQLGKRSGKDALRGKLTYPGLLGVDASQAEVQRLHGEALEALDTLDRLRAERGMAPDTAAEPWAGSRALRALSTFLVTRDR